MNNNDIFTKRLKPNLNNYDKIQLINIINQYYLSINSNSDNILLSNLENKNNDELIKIIIDLWKNHPIQESNEIIDCLFCLGPITNSDYMITECGHLYHSTCFINYLFNSFCSVNNLSISNSLKKNKISNYFRCPKCRKNLTEQITSNKFDINSDLHENIFIETDNLIDNSNIIDQMDISVDLISGLWIENNSNNYSNNYSSSFSYSDSSDSI